MKFRSRKVAMYFGLALVMMLMPILPASITASTTNEPDSENGYFVGTERTASYVENAKYMSAVTKEDTNIKRNLYYGKAVACAQPYLEVKETTDDSSATVGKLFEYNIADVLEQNETWTKISSGNLVGFVMTSTLCFDEEAQAVARLETTLTASVAEDGTAVYSNDTDNAEIIATYALGTKVTPVYFFGDYIVIQLEDQSLAYIISSNVSIDYGFETGLTIGEEEAKIAAAAAAEEARIRAEEEARAAAERARAAEEALRQQVISRTKSGTDFTYNPTMQVSNDDIWLMACIIDWESGWESYEGKLAVANIILNRVRSSNYPNTISGVIYARNQFSGVSDGSGNATARFAQRLASGPRTDECVQAALQALTGVNNVKNFTAFISTGSANFSAYSDYMVIGAHCFY